MRRRIACWLLMAAGIVIAAASAAQAQCPPPPPAARAPQVRMERFEPRLVYRHDVDLVGLPNVGHTFEHVPRGGIVLGLTARNDQLQIGLRAVTQRRPDGRYCAWITEVTARVGDPEMDVYVAGNYPVGSCEYDTVLRHENQHVAINRSVVEAYAPRIGAELRAAVPRVSPRLVARPDDASGLTQALMAALEPINNAMLAELRRRNGEIDTPENYRRTQALCRNWFPPGTRLPPH